MITKEQFSKIEKDITNAYIETFDFAKKNQNEYIQFLSRVFYDESIKNPKFTSWQVDRDLERILDHDRVDFVLKYLNENYNFKTGNSFETT